MQQGADAGAERVRIGFVERLSFRAEPVDEMLPTE
jgi:hypothetical protein